jgi:hypothetical protein
VTAPQEKHGAHELGFDLPPPAVISRGRAAAIGLLGAALLGAAFVVGYLPRRAEQAALVEIARSPSPAACSRSRRPRCTRAPAATCAAGTPTSATT